MFRLSNQAQLSRLVVVMFFLGLGGCGKEVKSQVGESCARSADCTDGARCIKNTCVNEQASEPVKPPTQPGNSATAGTPAEKDQFS